MSQVLPDGVGLIDAPHTWVAAIRMGMVYLSWNDNLPREEIPPKRIWLDEKRLKQWWKDIERKRKADEKGQSQSDDVWTGEMKQNDAARMLVVED